MKPNHLIGIIVQIVVRQGLDISLVSVQTLNIVCFENTADISMPCFCQMRDKLMHPGCVVK
jgi:hypothetical protein